MIIINPGSGPVADASLDQARDNIEAFCADLRTAGHESANWSRGARSDASRDEDGRYGFTVTMVTDGVSHSHEIDMPGISLDRVRWMSEATGNIWDYPRLYVDGSSWIWAFALGVCVAEEDDA